VIKLLNILSEEIGGSDDNSVVGFEFKSMKPYRKKGRDGNYIPGYPWYVYFNGLKLVKGMWSPGDNFIVELTGNGEHFELKPQEFRYNQQNKSGSIPLSVLKRTYPRLNLFGESNNIVTPDKIRQALKIAFEDNWLEEDDIYSPGIRGIYTIGDKTGTDESWSVVNYFDTKKEVQDEINRKWKREGEGDFIYWLADIFENDIQFMNKLVGRQWQSISNGYENEKRVSEILSNELGGDSQLFPPGSKKDRYELIDMIINGDNYQIKPSNSIKKEDEIWKVRTYGMNNRYKGKNLQYIAYGTNGNKVYVFPNRNYNVSDSGYVVEHYEDPLIYPNNQLSEQVSNSDKLIKGIQSLVDHALVKLNNMSEEMGLGEMFFINEIDSVENIKVSDFYKRDDGTNMLHIIIEVSGLPSSYEYYKLTRYIIDDEINKIIPNTEVSAKINGEESVKQKILNLFKTKDKDNIILGLMLAKGQKVKFKKDEIDLRKVDLSDANLSGADLRGADLSDANLSGANLGGADLSYAKLSWTYLSKTNLSKANLSDADLSHATLSYANLSYANLRGADLSDADLRGADLRDGKLSSTNLHGADLRYAKGLKK